jgi:hypothetical protein
MGADAQEGDATMRRSDAVGTAVLLAAAVGAASLAGHGIAHPGLLPGSGGAALSAPTAGHVGTGSTTSAQGGRAGRQGSGSGAGRNSASGKSSAAAQAATLTPTGTLLASSPYAAFAFQVYPTAASGLSQAADGFTIQVPPDGAGYRLLKVESQNGGGGYSQAISSRDRVYFVEGQMGDDGPGSDVNFGDDGVLITNAKGYILK